MEGEMKSTWILALGTLICGIRLCLAPAIASEDQNGDHKWSLGGDTLSIVDNNQLEHSIYLNNNIIYVNRDSEIVTIVGIYEADGSKFGLVLESPGGNSCSGDYRVLDMKHDTIVTPSFGNCDEARDIHIVDGALQMTVTDPDMQSETTYRAAQGKVTSAVRLYGYHPFGPERAPNDDLATLISKSNDVVNVRAAANAITSIMGEKMFTASRKRIQAGVSGFFESRGDFFLISACERHQCSTNETAWAFDHFGHAWASWTEDGKSRFFGKPPRDVREAMTPARIP